MEGNKTMGNLLGIALAIIFISSSHALTFAQNRSSTQSRRYPQKANLTFPSSRLFSHQNPIQSDFDKFDNRTSMSVETELRVLLKLRASFSYVGNKLSTPPSTIVLIFETFTSVRLDIRGINFLKNREITILADGRVIRMMGVYDSGDVNPTTSYRPEYLGIELPIKTYLMIVNAHSVSAKVAGAEVDFSEENLEALRDLASRMNPHAQEQPPTASQPNFGQVAKPFPTSQPSLISTNLLGAWRLQIKGDNGQVLVFQLTIRQKGDTFNGMMQSSEGIVQFDNISINGNSFSTSTSGIVQGQTVTIGITGKVEGDRMNGSITITAQSRVSLSAPFTGMPINQ
jgi:hypothetical protein